MAILQNSCCGCCNLRTGCIVVGVLFLILHLIDIAIKASNIEAGGGWPDILGVAIEVLAVIIVFFLFYGVIKEIRVLLLVWVVFVIVILVVELIVAIITTVYVLSIVGPFTPASLTLLPFWIIYLLMLCLVIYGVLVVYSHYQNLRDGITDDGAAPPPGAYPPGTAAPPPGYELKDPPSIV